MALPNKRIKKVKLPNSNEAYEIIPERLQNNGHAASLPTLSNDEVLALSKDVPGVIDVTSGVNQVILDEIRKKPNTVLKYAEGGQFYYYVPQYSDPSSETGEAPCYYNCFEGDVGTFRLLYIDWADFSVSEEITEYPRLGDTSEFLYDVIS